MFFTRLLVNIAHHVERGARLFPARPALSFEGETFSYAELDQESNRAANAFTGLGVMRGDRVAIWLPNTAAFIIAYLGLQKLGAVAVTINTGLKAAEIDFILKDSGAEILLTTAALYAELAALDLSAIRHTVLIEGEAAGTHGFAPLLRSASSDCASVATAPDDPAAILYTSGTTGFPKGALLSHKTVVVSAQMTVATLGLQPDDRVLLCLSMFHSFAQTAALHPCLEAGATLILHRQFEAGPVLRSMQEMAATVFFGVPTLYILLTEQAAPAQLQSVRRFISAGMTLPVAVLQRWHEQFGSVINEGYGLTEICLGTFNHNPLAAPGSVGRPLAGVQLRVVNEAGGQVAPGELGEIHINTPSMMLRYWQRPDETAAVLRDGWFHTGDIGRVDEEGNYYIIDRIKDMVNVGGVKVYPSEVEQILYQHPAVKEAAVYGVPEALLGEQVQANVVLKPDAAVTPQALLAFCRERLAEFKLPSAVHLVDQLPKSRTGKILKRLLREQAPVGSSVPATNGHSANGHSANGYSVNGHHPPPATSNQNGAQQHSTATVALAQQMAGWLADQLQISATEIDWNQPFAEYGMTSILAVNLAGALSEWLGQPVPAILLWNFPTIRDLVAHLQSAADSFPPQQTDTSWRQTTHDALTEPIALVGIGCRFPGNADTPAAFWQLLRNGVDTARPLPADRWNVADYYDPTPNTPGKMYVRAGSFLERVDRFDAAFFGISPLEAAAIDPQQRLLLEVCWEALEHANLAADHLRESRTGVYVGAFWDDYSAQHLYNATPEQIDSYRVLSNLRGMTAGRLAYVLGLHGPTLQLDTACSSSLLAVHLACQALRTGECDLAMAGGVSLALGPEQLIGLSHMGAVSPDGRCKTFAATADGFGIGEGAGVVVLKRLSDALSAGDRVLAVIRGSAVNHDGASNGLTAPNGRAQEMMWRQALTNANVRPNEIHYVETHGTGTVLGDPIEVQALLNVLGEGRTDPLWLGSVKTNIGHLSAAAGVAALTKVVLSLQAGEIPPNLHFTAPNPHIPWATAPLAVPTEIVPWPTDARRLAGVSSFGLTGTNVHLIVEAAPNTTNHESRITQPTNGAMLTNSMAPLERPYHLLTLSAKTEQALAAQVEQMAEWLAAQAETADDGRALADLCYTAATSRVHWGERLSIIAPDLATAQTKLRQAPVDANTPGIIRSKKTEQAPKVAFLFPGQGPQYVAMGRQLYETQPLFRRTLQQCDEILCDYMDQALLTILYGPDKERGDALLNEATYAQPALFAIEYALATLWRAWGVEPAAVIGHSMGEYAAACFAGVFSLEEGLRLIAARGRLMQEVAPKGQMVAVLGSEATVREVLAPYAQGVALAAINTPQSLVISGSKEAIQEATGALQQAGLEIRPLKIHVASHSPLMEPILAEFRTVAESITYHRPQLQVISNVTGAPADMELTTPAYWCRHLREPVQFAQGMATIAGLGIDTFIEAGPKATLLGLGQQCWPLVSSAAKTEQNPLWLTSIHPKNEEWVQLLESLATLHGRGATIDWHAFDQEYSRQKVDLPRYPFQRQRYWLDDAQPKPVARPQASQPVPTGDHPLLGRQVHSVLAARNQELLFENRFDLTTLPYLADHALFDQPIVPGAAYFAMVLAAGSQLWPQGQPVLTECAIQQGLFLPTAEQRGAEQAASATVQVVLTPAQGGYQWQIYSLLDGAPPTDPWTLHASGRVSTVQTPTPPPTVDLTTVRSLCATVIEPAHYEAHLRDQGITYGPQFQALTQLFVGEGEALGYVTLPQAVAATGYQLHPVLLDTALRVASSLLPTDEEDPYLPFSVEAVQLYDRNAPTRFWSHVQARPATADEVPGSRQVDLTLIAEDGHVVAQLTNFTLRRANRQALLGNQRRLDWLYELTWKAVSRPRQSGFAQKPGRWLILADDQGYGTALATRLEAQGAQCILLHQRALAEAATVTTFQRLLEAYLPTSADKLQGVVYLWGLDRQEVRSEEIPTTALQVSTQVLHLVQALLRAEQSPRLWLVTQAAVAADADQLHLAPLWGLGRTLHWEEPALACTAVDLPATFADETPAMLFREIWFADGENQILLRGDERLVARLARHRPPTTTAQPLVFHPESSYLVTGGLGGLGLRVAQWLVAQGARHLVLAGRRRLILPDTQAAIHAMEEAGAKVLVVQADIAYAADVQRLLAATQALAPLRGVIHAAGVIDDGLLLQQTAARFAQVMAPKVAGTWHLHTQTCDLPLDFFVAFSSVSSLLGNRGQSNYAAANAFMDALAQQRRQAGLPALSINWGGWAEVGLAATLVKENAAAGLGAIAPAQGVDLLGLLLTGTAPQVGVLPIQWRQFQQGLNPHQSWPLLTDLLTPATEQKQTTTLRQQLATVAPEERYTLVKEHVQALIHQLLGATPAPDESFLLFGLDSLLSIQLANRLAAALGVTLPATLAFKYETVERLTQFLLETATTPQGASAPVDQSPNHPITHFSDTWYPQLYNQQECYIWHETVSNKACLHIQQAVYIRSPIDAASLTAALQTLVTRHEALRTVYTRQGEALLQRTLVDQTVDFAVVDVANQPWSALAEAMLADARAPFDLAQGPLLRGRLYSRAADDHIFVLVVHHIAADATALSVIINELWAIYGALQAGNPIPLAPVSTGWHDFVRWQQDLLQSAEGERLWRFWQTQLAGELPRLQLPTDYPRPVQDSHHGQPCYFELDAALIQQLRHLAQREGCTLYMVLMAGFQLLLHRYSRQRDLIVAAHVANRNEAAFADVVGYLADTFPIRAYIGAEATFQSLLHEVQATILAAMDHQGFPLRLLAERLGVQEDPSRPVLAQVWFTLLPLRLFQESGALFQSGNGAITLGGLTLEATDLLPAWLGAWYDLEMILTEGENVVFGTLVYKSELFAEATILRMIADFQRLLKAIAANPSQPVAAYALDS
ncbi:MAG: SDR family NAD(P)-dependent oxidoreductase [Caldilinea sp. CFX5]|nr:SDR family NAD(P)-dependent oxidoreductase [Caldilinea sp. CFX5]